MAMFSNPRELPDELLPYSGKLSERFYEVRQNVAEFCQGAMLRCAPRPPSPETVNDDSARQTFVPAGGLEQFRRAADCAEPS